MSKPAASRWHPPGKFFVLLAAFFLLYILMPLVRDLRLIFLLSDVLLAAVLLATVYAVSASRRTLIAAALLMGLSLALLYLGRNNSQDLMGAAHISILLFFVFTAVIILKDVLREERVTGDKIADAISFCLLLAFLCLRLIFGSAGRGRLLDGSPAGWRSSAGRRCFGAGS